MLSLASCPKLNERPIDVAKPPHLNLTLGVLVAEKGDKITKEYENVAGLLTLARGGGSASKCLRNGKGVEEENTHTARSACLCGVGVVADEGNDTRNERDSTYVERQTGKRARNEIRINLTPAVWGYVCMHVGMYISIPHGLKSL